jgi:cysteine sulfinate desulfinase/cysteine desulfurase-like protein
MIYLDHNATTSVLPEVLEAMLPYLAAEWGNPSSTYKFGSKLKTVIETAREQVGELIGAQPTELNRHKTERLANTTNITFHGIESEALLILLDKEGVCASSGSACLADSDEPSHVVKAMKPESSASRQMIRFSLDAANTADEIKTALVGVRRATDALRAS